MPLVDFDTYQRKSSALIKYLNHSWPNDGHSCAGRWKATQSWWSKPMDMPYPVHAPLLLQQVLLISFFRISQKTKNLQWVPTSQLYLGSQHMSSCVSLQISCGYYEFCGIVYWDKKYLVQNGSEWCFCPCMILIDCSFVCSVGLLY